MQIARLRRVLPALLLLASALGAGAEQAILQRGPLPVRGIEFLPPNVLPAFRAEYLAGELRVTVLFTREPLVLPTGWPRTRCGPLFLRQVPTDSGLTLCWSGPLLEGEAPAYLFFSFEEEPDGGPDGGGACGWVEAFLPRFQRLLAYTSGSADLPFPAILEFRRR